MPQPVRFPAQQEQDEVIKFSGCTMSTRLAPAVSLCSGHGDACTCPGQDRPGASPHNTLLLPMAAFFAGWWFCQLKNKRGWVPAAYLEPLDGPDESEEQEPNYAGKMLG